jgi:CRISPR-associated protein Csd1
MILQALAEYYERKRSADPEGLPEPGFERKEIPFVIVLSEDGKFLNLEDTREVEGKQQRGRKFTVPQGQKRASGVSAFLLWDKDEYVLGVVREGRKTDRIRSQHEAFKDRIKSVFGDYPPDPGVKAVLTYLAAGDFSGPCSHPLWPEIEDVSSPNFGFRISGDAGLVTDRPAVIAAVRAGAASPGDRVAQCLVTGERGGVARLHPSIKGVRGAQSSGASIVSFNLDAFRTHGREQGANAPVSERAAFTYTTALNRLLDPKSDQKAHVGDTTVVFWADRDNPVENLAAALFGDDEDALDDPDRGVEKLRSIFAAPLLGTLPDKDRFSRFFVLGLAPNASRIAIRFWRPTTVAEFAAAVLRHFDNVDVVRPPWAHRHPSVRSLLRATAVLGKDDNIPPNLAGDVLDAIVTGRPYPVTLLHAAIRRVRAERDVTPDRAAVVKGCLTRLQDHANPINPEVTVSLDAENRNIGYLLGRLFAALERTQETASPGIQRGIRERYYASASSTPTAAFPTLMKLKNHHLAKIENRGAVVNLERLLGSITEGIQDFPSVLPLADQGRFALGYYHQRQAFFTKANDGEDASHA